MSPPSFSDDIDDLLADGEAYAAQLAARPPDQLTDEEVVALGYLERTRLGLGSPFRLIAYVAHDPRLSPDARQSLAYAILDLTLDGHGYRIDPVVLDRVRLAGVPVRHRTGVHHLRLIERTIEEAPIPVAGERAVRIGYALAEAEQSIEAGSGSPVALVAALVADRYRARADARDLLRGAASLRKSPLVLLDEWRGALRFRVERPALIPVPDWAEATQARIGMRVALSLRLSGQRLSTPLSLVPDAQSGGDEFGTSWLTAEIAGRLLALADSLGAPPRAPIAVAVNVNREPFASRPDLEPEQREERLWFVETAWNEERLVAAAARLRDGGAEGQGRWARLALIELQAATFLRGWNQEEPWFPGDPAPAAKDIEARFGLDRIVFDPGVPESWRPYYRRAVARGLADLQRVLPTASLRGLTIRIGDLADGRDALALHDPGSRTIVLPVGTGAGTLAHEIAHDLDWQLARSRYGKHGGYATDLAVQHRPRDRIATSLTGLAASFVRDADDKAATPHRNRPAEVFARGMDWFVAAMLAREGRTGGYLTSFQDPAITGYGSTRSPDVGGSTVPALFTILDYIAPVVPEAREWALDRYGPLRTLSSMELVRAVTGSGAGLPAYPRLDAIERARDLALDGLSAASCALAGGEDARRFIGARRELIRAAAGAAARGAVTHGIRAIAADLDPALAPESVDAWLAWRLYGAPEPAADSALAVLAPGFEPLLLRSANVATLNDIIPDEFSFSPAVTICGGNPFAISHRVSGGAGAIHPLASIRAPISTSSRRRTPRAAKYNGSARAHAGIGSPVSR